jgi:amino acid adenylation domain-containing protein
VQPDDPIGLYVERSIDMIVGMLGVLKAGGAYLPLDPQSPGERLSRMLQHSNTEIVLTQRKLQDDLLQDKVQTICLDDERIFADKSIENPECVTQPHNLAYIIYTSGSTGLPKGVMVEHRSLVNYCQWAREDWALSPEDHVLQFTEFIWDVHIEEVFPTLMSGASLILRSDSMIDTFMSFLEDCRAYQITLMNLPTSYWNELTVALKNDHLELPSSIRQIIISGEKVLKSYVKLWYAHTKQDVRLFNSYGLTECTSTTTQYEISKHIPSNAKEVPVGKPINNVQTYVLNTHKNPVAMGIPGELWVGGISLARGYLNDPQLTEERFLPNNLDKTPGNRLFRTGDLARFLPDGNIEILGRIDQQIKIRGHRIEPGEIEAVLNEHPSIQKTVVLAKEIENIQSALLGNEMYLVAYYVTNENSNHDLTDNDLRNFLKQKLPEYMIPSIFIKLESFPMNLSGKVDRGALPPPRTSDLRTEKTYLPPRSELEGRLVEIWEDVMNIHPIGVMDNFFELGGHSLLAVRLFSAIEKELNIKLPLAAFFESATIANQAKAIHEQVSEDRPILVGVETGGEKPPFFCVSPTIIDVMTYIELSKNMGKDQPFYALYSPRLGQWREGTKQRQEIAKKFIEEIRKISPDGPYFIGGYSAGGVIALEIAQQMQQIGSEVDLLVLFDTFGPDPPQRLPWATPWIFNLLLVLRRVESYLWKFRILDWKGKLEYLQIPKIRSWIRDRYWEVNVPQEIDREVDKEPIYFGGSEYSPETYPGKVLLIRAEKGLLGIYPYPDLGWGKIFTGDFEICEVPGDHEAILFGPRARYVAERLNFYLNAAD